jgi:hypothetical protein
MNGDAFVPGVCISWKGALLWLMEG